MMQQVFVSFECRLLAAGLVANRTVEQTYVAARDRERQETRVRVRLTNDAELRYTYSASARQFVNQIPEDGIPYALALCTLGSPVSNSTSAFDVARLKSYCGEADENAALVLSMSFAHCDPRRSTFRGSLSLQTELAKYQRALTIASEVVRNYTRTHNDASAPRTFLFASPSPSSLATPWFLGDPHHQMVHRHLRDAERNFTTSGPGEFWELIDTELTLHLGAISSTVHTDTQHYCMPGIPDVFTDVWASVFQAATKGARPREVTRRESRDERVSVHPGTE